MAVPRKANKINPKVGDRLYIPANHRQPGQWVIVTRVTRIKFEAIAEDRHQAYLDSGDYHYAVHTWRKDTAREDGAYSDNSPTIYTPEQWELHLRESAASGYLRGLGIEVWRMNRDIIAPLALANLIRNHLGEEEI